MNRVQMVVIDLAENIEYLGSYASGLWQFTGFLTETQQADSFWTDKFGASYDNNIFPKVPYTECPQINIDNVPLLIYDTLSELKHANKGSWLDVANQIIVVKMPDYDVQFPYEITMDQSMGIVDKATKDSFGLYTNSFYNGIYFEPRLNGSISVQKTIDFLLSNRMTFDGFNFSVINNDGFFDSIRPKIVGSEARYMIAEDVIKSTFIYDDFSVEAYGTVENVSFTNPNSATIRVTDTRKDWEYVLNDEFFDIGTYPGIKDSLRDKRKPLCFGSVKNIELERLLADTETNPTRTWFVASDRFGSTSVTKVYQELSGDRTTVSSSDYTYTSSTGLLIFNSDRDPSARYFADITGASVKIDTNPDVTAGNLIDIALSVILQYTPRDYNELFFDTDKIDSLRKNAKQGAYYTGTKGVKVKEAVEYLLSSNNVRIQPLGDILTMFDLSQGESTYEIEDDELVAMPGWEYDNKYYFSSITCGYDKDWANDTYSTTHDASLVATAVENNTVEIDYEYNTALTNRGDAEDLSYDRYEQSVKVPLIVSVKLAYPLQFDLLDIVTLTVKRGTVIAIDRSDYQVVAINKAAKTAKLLYVRDNPLSFDISYTGKLYNEELNNDNLY